MRLIAIVFILFFSVQAHADLDVERLSEANWIKLTSPHFIVITDAKEKVGKGMIRDLEKFRFFIPYILQKPMAMDDKPLKILAIKNTNVFKALDLPEQYGGIFYKTMIDDFAVVNITHYSMDESSSDQGKHTLMHEYVHYATRSLLTSIVYPIWYSEGEAEYLATFRLIAKGKAISVGSMSVIGNRLWSIQRPAGGIENIDVEDLFKTTNLKMGWRRDDKNSSEKRKDSRDTGKFYARAMITYHYLQSTKELSNKKKLYIELINQGWSVDHAFQKSFNVTYTEMDKAIVKYASGKYVSAWRYDLSGGSLSIPEVNPVVEKLSLPQKISNLIGFISQMRHYKVDEMQAAFTFSKSLLKQDANLLKAELDWSLRNNIDVAPLISDIEKYFSDNLELKSIITFRDKQRVEDLMYVGHPSAVKELKLLRNRFREILRADMQNRISYFGLGMLSSATDENTPSILNEADLVLENAKLILGESFMNSILSRQLSLNSLSGNFERLLQLKHQYATISESDWIEKGYGRFVREMLELRHQGQVESQYSNNQIHYTNGEYQGEIQAGKPHGKGVMKWDGARLTGNFVDGKLQGNGELISAFGYHFTGNFVDGIITGNGEIIWPNNKDVLRQTGNFLMGQEHGQHKVYLSNGDLLDGQFRVGFHHGHFIITRKDKSQLERDFYLGSMRIQLNNNIRFVGGWDENYLAHGDGICYHIKENKVEKCHLEHGMLKDVH